MNTCQIITCEREPRRGFLCTMHFSMLPRKHRRRIRGTPPYSARHIRLAIKWLVFA